jgi:PhnB protein
LKYSSQHNISGIRHPASGNQHPASVIQFSPHYVAITLFKVWFAPILIKLLKISLYYQRIKYFSSLKNDIMASANPYLNFNGNTEEVFIFYKSVFGTEFTTLQRFEGNPGCEGIPLEEQKGIMHVSLPISANSVLMGTDVPSIMPQVTVGTNISISLQADSEEEANKLFNGLSAGGKVDMPLEKMFWNALFGMFTDKFGIQWMVNYDYGQTK